MTDVLVTGAAGFVGAALVRDCLERGASVAAMVRPGSDVWRLPTEHPALSLHHVDLLNQTAVRDLLVASHPDYVFHLAAHGAYSWQQDAGAVLGVNVLGTACVLEACRSVDIKGLVSAGSSSEYGFKDHAPSEDERLDPNSVYAVGKAAASHLVRLAATQQGLPAATARLYSVYGPWEAPERLVPRMIMACLRGSWPPLTSPSIARDFVFIDDVVAAFWALATAASDLDGEAFNVCRGVQVSIGDLAGVAAEVFGVNAEPQWGGYEARGWDTDVWVGDPRRLIKATRWAPVISLEEGLALTAEWIQRTGAPAGRY